MLDGVVLGRTAKSPPIRILDGFVCRYEKPVLLALARGLPQWVKPDHLTLVGLLGAALAGIALVLTNYSVHFLGLAAIGVAVNWYGDSLDGTLARVRGIERQQYGFFVDHLADVAAQAFVILGLGFSPFVRLDIACLIFIAYMAMTVYTLVTLQVTNRMRLTYHGVGPTEIRVLLVLGMLIAWTQGHVALETPFGTMGLYNVACGLVAAFALASLVSMAIAEKNALSLMDPPSQSTDRHQREDVGRARSLSVRLGDALPMLTMRPAELPPAMAASDAVRMSRVVYYFQSEGAEPTLAERSPAYLH